MQAEVYVSHPDYLTSINFPIDGTLSLLLTYNHKIADILEYAMCPAAVLYNISKNTDRLGKMLQHFAFVHKIIKQKNQLTVYIHIMYSNEASVKNSVFEFHSEIIMHQLFDEPVYVLSDLFVNSNSTTCECKKKSIRFEETMDELKYLTNKNNIQQITVGLQKLLKTIRSEKVQGTKENQIKEIDYLRELCTSEYTNLSLLAHQAFVRLVEDGTVEAAACLSMFMTMLPNTK